MSQINVNPNTPNANTPVNDSGQAAATNNLTWAIAVILIIAAIVIAVVYLNHNLHW